MTDQQALEHIDQRMTEARDAEGRLSAKQATIDMTRAALNEAGVLSGPLPERVRKLSADLRDVTADRDRLRADLNAIYNIITDFDPGESPGPDGFPARLRELLTDRTPPAPDVAPVSVGVGWSGYGLSINGDYFGEYCEAREGGWWVHVNGSGTGPLPNELTARAVLLALAGQECGRVEFGLREDAPVGALIAAVIAGLGSFVTDLVAGGTTWTKDPATVRAWVEHGQAALTIEAVSDAK